MRERLFLGVLGVVLGVIIGKLIYDVIQLVYSIRVFFPFE
jgi:hypothetical protein